MIEEMKKWSWFMCLLYAATHWMCHIFPVCTFETAAAFVDIIAPCGQVK